MNKDELKILKEIKLTIIPYVKNIELNKYHDGVSFKIIIPFDTLEKLVEKYYEDKEWKPKIISYFHYEETNEYPLGFYYKKGKYYIKLYKNYIHGIKETILFNVLVKNMRNTDKNAFKILKQIKDENLFKNLDIFIDKNNINYIIEQKGNI
jgi:hypothetical protein